MKLVFGLGNAGVEYAETRHNLGMRVVLQYAKERSVRFKKHSAIAEVALAATATDKTVLMHSTGYMNESGKPLQEVAHFYKINPEQTIIIYDDLDLPFGTIRISTNTSSGGHNGIKSIIEHLGSADFIRVRLGIGPKLGDAADYVLDRWSKEQSQALPEFIAEAMGALNTVLEIGFKEAAAIYN